MYVFFVVLHSVRFLRVLMSQHADSWFSSKSCVIAHAHVLHISCSFVPRLLRVFYVFTTLSLRAWICLPIQIFSM